MEKMASRIPTEVRNDEEVEEFDTREDKDTHYTKEDYKQDEDEGSNIDLNKPVGKNNAT